MSITWRIKVYDEGFTSRTQPGKANNILTPADAFASLDSFDVEGSGNCLEARFRCVPSLVDIRPRDIIELEVSEDGGSSYTRVYRGYIVVAGNARSTEIEAYKAVGLKQRFYEKVNKLTTIEGDDIATMVSDVHSELISDSYLPSGVAALSADAPTLSIVLGDRYPQLETVGATYDALAEQAGAFIVASGTTYTYDGVTYAAGETVPAVQWGVDADGNLFFKRWQRDALVAAEDDEDKFVRYGEIAAENKVDNIALVYASDFETFGFDNVRYSVQFSPTSRTYYPSEIITAPLVRHFDFGGDKSAKVIAAASPPSVMIDISDSFSTSGTVTNASNAYDGDLNTYASITSGSIIVDADTSVFEYDGLIAHVKFSLTSSSNTVTILNTGDGPSGATNQIMQWNVDDLEDDEIFDIYLPILPMANGVDNSGNPSYTFVTDRLVVGGSNLRVYEIEFLVPDVDDGGTLSEEYAEIFVSQPNTNVAEVSQFGSLGLVTQTMTFTPSGESSVDVPVERVSYQLSTRDGLVTTYHLGQAYDAELLSERAVLEALAQRSVS